MYILLLLAIFVIMMLSPLLFKSIKTNAYVTIGGVIIVSSILFRIIMLINNNTSISFFNNIIYIDSLSAIQMLIIGSIDLIVSIYTYKYINEELNEQKISLKRARLFYFLFNTYVFFMLFVAFSNNVVVMWIGLEATTLSTAFLIGFNENKNSLEAAWKYIIICSIGIGIGLVGILIFVSSFNGHSADGILNWSYLRENYTILDKNLAKISFALIFIGIGTKAGLAPMHTWLPDAHSEAPSPVSAMMSGVLLNLALYVVLRFYIIEKHIQGLEGLKYLFIIFGVISFIVSAFSILKQINFKRLLAFSSVENIGIIALGIGIGGPIAVFGALLHSIIHAFGKTLLFLVAGNILSAYKTMRINKINALIKTMPINAFFLILGILVITGTPPFASFFSEYKILVGSIVNGQYLIMSVYCLCLLLVVAGFLNVIIKVVFNVDANVEYKKMDKDRDNILPLVICSLFIVLVCITMNGFLTNIINSAVSIIIN
jgi:hydrogenase-4 component F